MSLYRLDRFTEIIQAVLPRGQAQCLVMVCLVVGSEQSAGGKGTDVLCRNEVGGSVANHAVESANCEEAADSRLDRKVGLPMCQRSRHLRVAYSLP